MYCCVLITTNYCNKHYNNICKNEKKRLWHRCFPVNLKGSLVLLKRFPNDGTKKVPQ